MITIHFPLEGRREKPFGKEFSMANLTVVKKAPVVRGGAGRVSTEPFISISENGQLTFNKAAMAPLLGAEGKPYRYAVWLTDAEGAGAKRKATTCQLALIPSPANWQMKPGEDGLPDGPGYKFRSFGVLLEKDVARINWSYAKEDKQHTGVPIGAGVTLSGDLRAIGYDFKGSGGQKFSAAVEGNTITWTVPVGTMPKRVVTPREKKVSQAANGASQAANGAVKQATEELEQML